MRRRTSASWSSIVVVRAQVEPPVRVVLDSTKARGRRCQRSARRGGGSASSGERERPRAARSSSAAGVSPRASASSASPSSAAVAGLPASATKRLSRAWCGRCVCDHSRTCAVQPLGGVALPGRRSDAAELDALRGPRPNGAWAASAVASACRWSSSASRRSPLASAIDPSPASANAAWSPNPTAPASSSARRYASTAAARVLPSLRDPRLEQQPGNAERVVADRVRVPADRRRHRGDGGDVAGARRADRADEAARRDAPVVAGRLERGATRSAPSRRPVPPSPDCASASASVNCASPSCRGAAAVAASASARSPAASAASRSSSSVAR